MQVSCREVFGPVVTLARVADIKDAVAKANGTDYGLQAGVFTQDITRAMWAAQQLDFGGVTVNEAPTWRADHMPYGGVKESGNTREGPKYAVQEMTEPRLVVIGY
jgi:acyl-CoA reductase-like NAD-dependent aldehyde dehydrogenase